MVAGQYRKPLIDFGLYLILILFLFACGFRNEKPFHRDKVEVGTDAKGRVIYKKFDQFIDDRYGRSVATITQHFDTVGRLLSEFGTDHPRLGKQYLYDVFYGDTMRVVNYFRWLKVDTTQLTLIPPSAFVEQKIMIDTASLLKMIRITTIAVNKNTFTGRYFETFPRKKPDGRTNRYVSYTFHMPLRNFTFDKTSRLVLKDIEVVTN